MWTRKRTKAIQKLSVISIITVIFHKQKTFPMPLLLIIIKSLYSMGNQVNPSNDAVVLLVIHDSPFGKCMNVGYFAVRRFGDWKFQ